MTTPYDAAWKLLFSFPVMPHDLLTGFVPWAWAKDLDPRTLEQRPGSQVSNGLGQRHQDCVWEARFRRRPGSILAALEFQSTVDHTMAVRMLVYTAMMYQHRLRSRAPPGKQAPSDERDTLDKPESPEEQDDPTGHDRPDNRESPHGKAPDGNPAGPLPSVLPIVLYHGKTQWKAAEDLAGLCAPPAEGLASYQPAQRYFLLDLGRYPGPMPEGRNLMAILVRLVQSGNLEQEAAVVDELIDGLREECAAEGLVRAFWKWMGYAHVPEWRRGMKWPVLEDWREAGTVLRESGNEWTTKWLAQGRAEGRVEGRAEGRVEGLTEGQAKVMRRQAARKFGPELADRLDERLAGVADPERVVEVGEWLLECESGEELLARVDGLCESSAAGDGAPPG